jgi:hypothetical protein
MIRKPKKIFGLIIIMMNYLYKSKNVLLRDLKTLKEIQS